MSPIVSSRSAVWSFSDPFAYEAAIRAADIHILSVRRAEFAADLTRVDVGKVWMQRFRDTAPRLARTSGHSSRSIIVFRAGADRGALRHGGFEVDDHTLLFLGAGSTDAQVTGGAVGLASMSLAPVDLAAAASLLAERDVSSPRRSSALRPHAAALARLKFLHDAAIRLARTRPDALDHPEVARGFDNAMISAMVRAVTEARPPSVALTSQRRKAIVGAVDEYLATNSHRPVYVAELCLALKIPERSLERACHEVLGVGPKRYLLLRRLILARRSLIEAQARETTVANIALAHGFWELGRFSVRYREAYGESPSETLRAPRRVSSYGPVSTT